MAEVPPLTRRIAAEGIGSFFLFACVIGSGIMAGDLSHGNDAVALLGNTLATGAILFVLITMLGPISGAHMNPAVSLVAASRGELRLGRRRRLYPRPARLRDPRRLGRASDVRPAGAAAVGQGAHRRRPMARRAIATFGLILTILGTVRHRPAWVPASVALYITAAYWFTSSTSFANPAITIARSLSDSFAGIAPADVPMFIVAQLAGAGLAALTARFLFDQAD